MKQSGYGFITSPEHDRVEEVPTLQCVHCGCHWVPRPGSGKVRGYCGMSGCMGPICGPKCEGRCLGQERYVELIEKGENPQTYDLNRLPTSVPVIWTP